MNIDGLHNLRLMDLSDIFKCDQMSCKEAIPVMQEFRDKFGLTDQEALRAFGVARRIFAD